MPESVLSLKPGLILAAVSLVLAALMVLVYVLTSRSQGRKSRVSGVSRLAESGLSRSPGQKLSPEVGRIWSDAVKSMEDLEKELNRELTDLEKQLAQERAEVQAKTEALKAVALEKRLPMTLYELYEGMRHFGKKSPQAQASDLEWHAKIGVTDLRVLDTGSKLLPGREINFKLDGESFSILGTHHRYSQTSFIEISLYDREDLLLVTVRVRPQDDGAALAEEAVISMKPGAWLQQALSCRARMDLRQQQVSLLTQHRDVQQLKESFAIQTNFSNPL